MAKPAGMAVHPCALYYSDTVGNWFVAHYGDENGFGIAFRPPLPAGQGYDRDFNRRQKHPVGRDADGQASEGLLRGRGGVPPAGRRDGRRPARPGCRARSSPVGWTFPTPAPSGRSPITGCSAGGTATPSWSAGWRLAAPTRSAPIWLISAIPSPGTASTAATPAYTLPRPSTAAKSPSPLPPPPAPGNDPHRAAAGGDDGAVRITMQSLEHGAFISLPLRQRPSFTPMDQDPSGPWTRCSTRPCFPLLICETVRQANGLRGR